MAKKLETIELAAPFVESLEYMSKTVRKKKKDAYIADNKDLSPEADLLSHPPMFLISDVFFFSVVKHELTHRYTRKLVNKNFFYCYNNRVKFFTLSLFLLSFSLFARDELIIIQAVTTSSKSFVIEKGAADGIAYGQESLFTGKDYSLIAKAVEVNRHYSMWQPLNKRAQAPFKKGEFVTYTNSKEALWLEVPELAVKAKSIGYNRTPFFIIKGSASFALSQSTANTQGTEETGRSGIGFEALYAYHYAADWQMNFGLRIDREVMAIANPALDIPTTRYFLIGALTYHFDELTKSPHNYYISGGLGIGRASSVVDGVTKSGMAFVLPSFHIGKQFKYPNNRYLLVEGVIESIAQSETFFDGTQQKTNIINAKLALGYKF